jgi:hypothetical protein
LRRIKHPRRHSSRIRCARFQKLSMLCIQSCYPMPNVP